MKFTELKFLYKKAEDNSFIAFDYKKEDGSTSKRVVRLGGDIASRLERQGTPIKGDKNNWITKSKKEGKNGFLVRRKGKVYIRGTEVVGKESQHKLFSLQGVSNLH